MKMRFDWRDIDDKLKSQVDKRDEFIKAQLQRDHQVRLLFKQETVDIVSSLVELQHKLAAAGIAANVDVSHPSDYWLRVGERSFGVQVDLALPCWRVTGDDATDEIFFNDEPDRGYWVRSASPSVHVDLGAYFKQRLSHFVDTVVSQFDAFRSERAGALPIS